MSGVRLMTYFQIGKETTKGTAVAATKRFSPDMASAFSVDWMKTYHEGRAIGYRTPVTYATQQGTLVTINYQSPSDTGVAVDELPYFLHFPSGGTAGSGATACTWGNAWGGTATGSALALTVEFGDDVQEYEAEYCQVQEISISADEDSVTQFSATLFGRQSTKSTKTSLSTVDAVRIPGKLWTLKHATAQSGLTGATLIPNFLRAWSAQWTTGLVPHPYMDGNYYFGQSEESAPVTGNVTLTVSSNSTAVSQYYDKGAAGTIDFARLKTSGLPNIGSSGTAYSAQFDYALEYTNVQVIGGDRNGVNTYEVTARIVSDSTWGQSVGSTVVASLLTL